MLGLEPLKANIIPLTLPTPNSYRPPPSNFNSTLDDDSDVILIDPDVIPLTPPTPNCYRPPSVNYRPTNSSPLSFSPLSSSSFLSNVPSPSDDSDSISIISADNGKSPPFSFSFY